jgi:hypothetical protein
MPLFQVKTRETIEHTYEVYARDEQDAESMVDDGFPDYDVDRGPYGIADHFQEHYGTEILDAYTTFLEDDPEPEDEDDD